MDALQAYWLEFSALILVHFLAVASPGPDFAIVLRHSVIYGRKIAIYTSIGIGLGILVHVTYSLLGIGLLIKNTPWLFNLLTYAAAIYILYLAWQAFSSKPPEANTPNIDEQGNQPSITNKKAFLIGLVTNGINPKATLFFLSVFAVAISPQTPVQVKLIYGIYFAAATGLWFSALSYFLSSSKVRTFIQSKGYWFDRLMGVVLILLAVKLVFFS